jgi:hypothetical protein
MRSAVVVAFVFTLIPQPAPPEPTGRLIDLGGHHLHLTARAMDTPQSLSRMVWVTSRSTGSWSSARSTSRHASAPTIVLDTHGAIPGRSLVRSIN